MQATHSYKYLGLLAVLILLCGLLFLVLKWPQSKRMTFSQHVAAHKQAVLYYILLFSAVLPLLLLFFVHWFVPTFGLSYWFSIFILASSILQYACTLIPEVGGWKTTVHQWLAGLSAICLMPAMIVLMRSSILTPLGEGVVALGLLGMLGIVGALILLKSKQAAILRPSFCPF
jgi:hypothetical protein